MSKLALFSINQQIEALRKELLNLVNRHGFAHPEVVKCSQKLDNFISEIQKNNVRGRL
jgi:hypothetical protein